MKKIWVFLSVILFVLAVDYPKEQGLRFTGKGDPKVLLARYLAWQEQQADRNAVVLALRTEGGKLVGKVKLALLEGKLELKLIQALSQPCEVWLRGWEHELKLATLAPGVGEFTQDLNVLPLPQNFVLQAVVVTQVGSPPSLAWAKGEPSLFARLYYTGWGQKLQLAGVGEKKRWMRLLPKPALAALQEDEQALEALVAEGRRIFHEETFGGNGRTCGTCHREDNNFTLDPAYIAKLKPDDPLFVHEYDSKLSGLEHPVLLRQMALIQANVDGFDKPPVLRGVPHLLSLVTSSTAEEEDLGLIAQSTGWSGDGAPGDGSLRMFAIGAIRQHLSRSLERVEGRDFRLPTEFELDALEAYMLSLGRQQDPNLKEMAFRNPIVERGKQLFDTKQNPVGADGKPIFGTSANCNGCHMNGGGHSSTTFANPIRDTGIENMPDQPHRLVDPSVAFDGGFGRQPRRCGPQLDHPCYGDARFSTPTAIEAADTLPFFHNNSVNTIEQVVATYTGPVFNNSPGALTNSGANRQIILDGSQMTAVALFLRAINVLENIDSSNRLDERAMALENEELAKRQIKLARSDTEDAVEVLKGAVYNVYPEALVKLKKAYELEGKAMKAGARSKRNRYLAQAIQLKNEARDLIATTT